MWPKKRTAFLVIHGIGEQNPFETLDFFVTNFLKVLIKKNHGKAISVKHEIKPRNGWIERIMSLGLRRIKMSVQLIFMSIIGRSEWKER